MKSKLITLLAIASMLSACGQVVDPGEVAVKVKLTGGSAGIDKAEVYESGKVYEGIDERIYRIDTKIQNYTWTVDKTEGNSNDESMTFATTDGVRINTDLGITYQITDPKKFLIAYKKEDEAFRQGELRNLVRDVLNTVGARYILANLVNTSGKSGVESLQQDVLSDMNAKLINNGVVIQRIAFVNGFRLPQNIQSALTATQESAQAANKAKQDLVKAEAELKVKQVQSQQAKVEGATLTPLLIEKMKLENQSRMIDKWNGQAPQVVNLGNSTSPLIVQPK